MAQDYPLILSMAKITQYCNTQQRNIPTLRKQAPDPIVEIHPDTAADLGIAAAEWVILETVLGSIKLKAKLNPSLHPSVVVTQHGWWQACSELGLPGYDPVDSQGANANLLVPNDQIDPISGSVPHRSYLCRVRKVGAPHSRARTEADALAVGS
jgi:anaerobic selenocysteine-containing dehydrogenase